MPAWADRRSLSPPFLPPDVNDFFNWVSTGNNYKSSFQSSWGANAKRRKRQQAEALQAEAERQARAAHAARAEAAETEAAAARWRRGSWSNEGPSPGGPGRGRPGRRTIDGFAPVGGRPSGWVARALSGRAFRFFM